MFLSQLMIDVGTNPDRPRPGRLWLRNIYHVHQRLCMAFPKFEQVSNDPTFLLPSREEGFPVLKKPEAVAGEPRHSFLFRIDDNVKDESPRAIILVQSELEPDWNCAFGLKPHVIDPRTGRPIGSAGCLLAAPPQFKEFNPALAKGDELRFRIRVNLSKKSKRARDGTDLRTPREGADKKGRPKDQGKRVAVTWERDEDPEKVIRPWFAEKGLRSGFTLGEFRALQVGWVVGYRPGKKNQSEHPDKHKLQFRSALLEGTLTVIDAGAFSRALASGIGPAKAFGFGLLSVAPLK